MDKFHQLPKVVQDCHKLIEWFIPQIEKLPRSRRFTLGEKIEIRLLELLELLIEAAYSRNKIPLLQQANLKIDLIRHLWRLGYSLQSISIKPYEIGTKQLVELGMQTGGWLKSQRSKG
ncbi:MAG: diversity-generating retroelement protein Avd [Thiotrichaceae bacterium]